MLTLRKSPSCPSSHCGICLNIPITMSINVGTKDTTMVVHFQNAPAKTKRDINYETYCLFALLVITCRQDEDETETHLLQIPQWCVLAGLGMMHFLHTATNGLPFFS